MQKKYYATARQMLSDAAGKFIVHAVSGRGINNEILSAGKGHGKDSENIVIFYLEDDGSIPPPKPHDPEYLAWLKAEFGDDDETEFPAFKWRTWETFRTLTSNLWEGNGAVVRPNMKGSRELIVVGDNAESVLVFAPMQFETMLAICEQSVGGIHSYSRLRALTTPYHNYFGSLAVPMMNLGYYEVKYAPDYWSIGTSLIKTQNREELIEWASKQQGIYWTPRW